ncbi:MAG: hypothetical protein M3083_24260 [Actinomycetota bacterium]|nr:hypothetical protein [Actinomycetota bacterium]
MTTETNDVIATRRHLLTGPEQWESPPRRGWDGGGLFCYLGWWQWFMG